MFRRNIRWLPFLSCLVAGSLMIAGCGGSGGSGDNLESVQQGLLNGDGPAQDPVEGGDFRFSTFTGVQSLDPADKQDGGATGGTEMAAIYDLLMRYDTESQEYVPQLAAGLEANDDNTVWTLRVRAGTLFNDGTDLNADAVMWSIARYVENRGTHAQTWESTVSGMKALDAATVEFTLATPWADFPTLLTTGPGMVVAPSSMESGEFEAIGAGPFAVKRFSPQDSLVLTARDDYWEGRPYLDTLQFPVIASESGKLDALQNGDLDAVYLRSAEVVSDALDVIPTGYVHPIDMGVVLVVNQRDDRAASDARVRKAITAAVDPDLFDERADSGTGMPGSDMFQQWSRWHGNVEGNGYDPEVARTYLEEAMADGYDGQLTYVGLNAPYAQNRALTFQSMLEAVGFTVDTDLKSSIGDLISAMFVNNDYDIGESGFNVSEESPFLRLYGHLHSESTGNVLGLKSEEIDALLSRLQNSESDESRREVLEQLQKVVNEDAPFVTVGAGKNFIAWKNAAGIVPSGDGIMLFGNASMIS